MANDLLVINVEVDVEKVPKPKEGTELQGLEKVARSRLALFDALRGGTRVHSERLSSLRFG